MAPRETASDTFTNTEVMAAHDEGSDEFVIADIAREDAWLAVRNGDAPVLSDWT